MRMIGFWQRALCVLIVVLPMLASAHTAPVTVFAAASLKEAMDQAATAYATATGTPVRVSYAASSALARQIEQGAPADVFVSADLAWMDYLQQRGLVLPGQRHNLLGNTLVLIAPASSTLRVDPRAPGAIAKALGESGRLAVGQTASVPAGKYAAAALRKLGQWDSVSSHLAESDSVRTALMLVSRGEAPLGIVYGSDARADANVRVVATLPEQSHDPIVYPVAALKNSRNPAAAAFVAWLGSKPAKAIFTRAGFSLKD